MAKHQPSEIRRAQLFQAAIEVCAVKGYHAARMEDIASRAGVSKGAVYHHFRSKQDLFLGLLESMIVEFKEQMVLLLRESTSASAGIRQAVRQFAAVFEQNAALMQGMMDFYLLGARDPRFREAFLRYYGDLVEVGAEFIRRGIAEGEFAPQHDAERVAWLLFTGGDGLIFIHVMLNQERRGLELMLEMVDLVLAGLARPKKEHA